MNIVYSFAFLLIFQFPLTGSKEIKSSASPTINACQEKPGETKPGAANIVFKSTDGGQTWRDISEGLPDMEGEGFERDGLFANDNGLYIRTGNGIYQTKPNATAPFWKKEVFPDKQGSIAPAAKGIFAYSYWEGRFLQNTNGTGLWSPKYTNFAEKHIRTVFETAGGTVFIGCDRGLFKTTNGGETWKQVRDGGWVIKMVESNGVLMATSQQGIIRSTDEGENWETVISEGGVGIDIERITGGFAAITYNTTSQTRRVRTSYDGGKTWQAIDASLPPSLSIASIIQVGDYFFCGHPNGILRSSDKGRTWKLILPSIEKKVFNLFGSGNAIYAIPRSGGC